MHLIFPFGCVETCPSPGGVKSKLVGFASLFNTACLPPGGTEQELVQLAGTSSCGAKAGLPSL